MKKITVLITVCLLVNMAGCAMLRENAAAIEGTGEGLTALSATAMPFNPAIGIGLLLIGGVCAAVGKGFQRKENNNEQP